MTQDDSNISPTIYLNNYYEEYMKGRATLLNVVNDVMDTYHRNKSQPERRYAVFFWTIERVKDRIVYKLINTEKNKRSARGSPAYRISGSVYCFSMHGCAGGHWHGINTDT